MEILITGGAGFIGANIAASYLKQAHQVTIFDNFSRAGVKNNISWLENQFSSKQIRVIEANVSDQ